MNFYVLVSSMEKCVLNSESCLGMIPVCNCVYTHIKDVYRLVLCVNFDTG